MWSDALSWSGHLDVDESEQPRPEKERPIGSTIGAQISHDQWGIPWDMFARCLAYTGPCQSLLCNAYILELPNSVSMHPIKETLAYLHCTIRRDGSIYTLMSRVHLRGCGYNPWY